MGLIEIPYLPLCLLELYFNANMTNEYIFLDKFKVCQLIPRQTLERTYGIIIPPPGEAEDPNRPPSAFELLNSYGGKYPFSSRQVINQAFRLECVIKK